MKNSTEGAKVEIIQVDEKARDLWARMDKNQRAGVRFGLFPADIMKDAEKEGINVRVLAIALMECAKKDGGMRA
jgi:hypothetical protein